MSKTTVPKGWTLNTWAYHSEALRQADKELRAADDRRYGEVAEQRAVALTIKETANEKALTLAREIQTYKDDKADITRERNLAESGKYVTRGDLSQLEERLVKIITPLAEYVSSQRGSIEGSRTVTTDRRQEVTATEARRSNTIAIVAAVIAGSLLIVTVVSLLFAFGR